MSNEIVRFYQDWGIQPGEEVSFEEALADGDYTRAQFDDSGAPLLAESYASGHLFHVDYWTNAPEDTRHDHLARHPGVPFGVQVVVSCVGGYRWSTSDRYADSGEFVGRLVRLERANSIDAALMTLRCTPQGPVRSIEKSFYERDGQLRCLFEYGPQGDVMAISDLCEGRVLRLASALATVDMPDFYREGFALPAGVDHSSVPLLTIP